MEAPSRIYLSPPDVGERERELLLAAFDSGWVAPVGPDLRAFEEEFAAYVGADDAAALSSGTAGLHLALLMLGVGPGDDVLVPTLTFVATANAVSYVGAQPVFLDCTPVSWNLDPELLAAELEERARAGRAQPAAVVTVDLYGQCADYDAIVPLCERYGVALIEDAAEALGASYGDRSAGRFGRMGVFSFNGNKVITTSGGGMLVAEDRRLVERARYLATQAREPAPHYEHTHVGFNYRLSNLLAALGRAQLAGLDAKLARRTAINERYRTELADRPGIDFLPEAPGGTSTHWLTVITIDPDHAGTDTETVRKHLETLDIESRPAWKPMHLQPLHRHAPRRGGAVAERIFATGLCLPSGSNLTEDDQTRVLDALQGALEER